MKLEICSSLDSNRCLHYYTKNTVSPVFLPLNITQIKTLLLSLCSQYSNTLDPYSKLLAVDIWFQLSEYAQKRIMNYYAAQDPHLKKFLAIINNEANDCTSFQTEYELIEQIEKDESISRTIILNHKLEYAIKNVAHCTVHFQEDRDSCVNVLIKRENGCFFATAPNGNEIQAKFKVRDIWDIEFI